MNELQVTVRCKVHDGQLETFRKLAQECMATVRARDNGTLQYDWFFNADQTECVVRERYRDSEAVLQHMANLGDTIGNLVAICDLSVEWYGEPSAELLEATRGLPTRVYSYFQGI